MFRKALTYEQTRSLLLIVGVLLLAAIAAIMYARRVDPVEVAATVMFLPVFMSFVLFGVRGGLIGGALAAIAYGALRYPAIAAVGAERFVGLIAARTIGYLAFGGIGGWASGQLQASISKLDLYDHVDDATGLRNSRALVETVDLEQSRSMRFKEIFSVVTIEQSFDLEPKRRSKLLRAIGSDLTDGLRTVDQATHAAENGLDIFSVVLPETASEGAAIFLDKLIVRLNAVTGPFGVPDSAWTASIVTFPGDTDSIDMLLERYRAIVKVDFPENAAV